MKRVLFLTFVLGFLNTQTAMAELTIEAENPTQYAYAKLGDQEEFIVGWGNPNKPNEIAVLICGDKYYPLTDLIEVKKNPNSKSSGDTGFYFLKDNPSEAKSCTTSTWKKGTHSVHSSSFLPRTIKFPYSGEENYVPQVIFCCISEFKWLTKDEFDSLIAKKKSDITQLSEQVAEAKKAQEAKQVAEAKKAQEAKQVAEAQRITARNDAASKFRTTIKAGDDTHCGLVIEVKKPIVKIQTSIGERWLKINQVFPAGIAECRFINGVYQDIN